MPRQEHLNKTASINASEGWQGCGGGTSTNRSNQWITKCATAPNRVANDLQTGKEQREINESKWRRSSVYPHSPVPNRTILCPVAAFFPSGATISLAIFSTSSPNSSLVCWIGMALLYLFQPLMSLRNPPILFRQQIYARKINDNLPNNINANSQPFITDPKADVHCNKITEKRSWK